MRYLHRLIAIVIGFTTWCIVTSTVAYALLPDPPDGTGAVIPPPSSGSIATETPLWKFVAVAAIAVLLAIAVVGLISSLRHARTSGPSRMLRA
jgi:hypothetical protein